MLIEAGIYLNNQDNQTGWIQHWQPTHKTGDNRTIMLYQKLITVCFILWPNQISSYICHGIPRSYPPLWSLQIKLKDYISGLRCVVSRWERWKMEHKSSKWILFSLLLLHLSFSKRTCLIGGNIGRSMQAYARSIFSQQQRSGVEVKLLLPSYLYSAVSLCKSPYNRQRRGGAFYPPNILASVARPAIRNARNVPACLRTDTSGNGATCVTHW